MANTPRTAPTTTAEMAVLDLAVAIGENRYKFSIMGPGAPDEYQR